MWPAYFLLFLMLAFPMVLSLLYVKAFLFGLLLLFVAVRGVMRLNFHLHLTVVVWTLALACVSLFFCLRGMFLGTPGSVQCLQVYAIWPLIYLFLLSGVDKMGPLKGLENTLFFSTVFISLFGAIYSLSQLGILPGIPFLESFFSADDLGIGTFEGYARLNFPGLNSFPFLVPFLMAALAVRWSDQSSKWVT